jgi:hypothetical protein
MHAIMLHSTCGGQGRHAGLDGTQCAVALSASVADSGAESVASLVQATAQSTTRDVASKTSFVTIEDPR